VPFAGAARVDRAAPLLIRPCTCHSPTLGPAPCACGRTTSRDDLRRHNLRSTQPRTMAVSVLFSAPMEAHTVPHRPRTARTTGELHRRASRRSHHHTRQRPGTPLTAGLGTRTPWCTP
jgi:hypothetical protein